MRRPFPLRCLRLAEKMGRLIVLIRYLKNYGKKKTTRFSPVPTKLIGTLQILMSDQIE